MATEILVKKLNKEMQILQKDVGEMKALLARLLAIPEESLKDYTNAAHVRRAFRSAIRSRRV